MAAMEREQGLIPLPDNFLQYMKNMPGLDFPAFLSSYDEPPVRAVRTNSGLFPEEAQERVPWEERSRYLPLDSTAGNSIWHEAGAWYLQEASAQVPVRVLAPEHGDRVLDLCAAPGGKSTQLAPLIGKHGMLVSNEYDRDRARVLSSNIERMGIANSIVVNSEPSGLAEMWPDYFDRILVDAPCSGEGMFRRHPETRSEWHESSPGSCHERQVGILLEAVRMLRPGGRLVYSTCTFNQIENEGTVTAFLRERPDMTLVPFHVEGIGGCDGMMHIWPHLVRGEGHFVALFERAEGKRIPVPDGIAHLPDQNAQKLCREFMESSMEQTILADGMLGDKLVKLPAFLPPLRGIRVLRLGLQLGEITGRLFMPDHALARAGVCRNRVPLSTQEAVCYLRGESLTYSGTQKGFCVLTYQGCPLGWGKISDGRINNRYPKGLRKNINMT